jgi:hypothetical protein
MKDGTSNAASSSSETDNGVATKENSVHREKTEDRSVVSELAGVPESEMARLAQSLWNRLEALVSKAKDRSHIAVVVVPLQTVETRLDELITRCVQLQAQLPDAVRERDLERLMQVKRDLVDCESSFSRLMARRIVLPSIMAAYAAIGGIFLLVQKFDFIKIVQTTFGIDAPVKYISLGIAGAFVYLATSILKELDRVAGMPKRVIESSVRFFLAMLVPIVLVSLFFYEDGTLRKASVSPELLSFACGYSAKLVIDVCNKVVEKVEKMIAAV